MKRVLAMLLALVLCLGVFAGCQGNETQEPKPQNQEPKPQKDDGILKILMIGHSLGNDSVWMLPEIFKNEGYEQPVVIGNLYHSGCRLSQHVGFLEADAKQYAYFEYDNTKDTIWQRADSAGTFTGYLPGTPNDTAIADGTIAQNMKFGIARHDWDIVVTQAGVFEAAGVADASNKINLVEDLKTVFDYVKENDIDKDTTPKLGWNMTWTCPSDEMMNDSYKSNLYNNFANQEAMYQAIVKTAKETVQPGFDFDYFMPSGTVMQNADSSYLTASELYRDTIHASDFGRVMVAYTWYCTLTGTQIKDCKLEPISWQNCNDGMVRLLKQPWELTQMQKDILTESVGNAMAKPFEVTVSQYQTAQ